MKKATRALAAIMTFALLLGFAGCNSNDGKNTQTSTTGTTAGKKYLIVADNSFAPFEFLDAATNTYVGVDMDILAAIAADQGFSYTVDNCGWDASLGNLANGQADGMIAGMTITDERKETYDFSNAYFEDGQTLFAKADSNFSGLEDIKGKTVAVKTGTMGASYVESLKEEYELTVNSYEGSDEVYAAVSSGNVDLGVEDFSVISYKIDAAGLSFKLVGEKVNVKPYGFAVLKGKNAELLTLFNAGLANIKANGTYETILAKYGI
ncbi:MAG: transporter substrate-binding domain-containing protein [Oscillospiraceae bacterium]|nr:transporter substrate-binding domain-containing protein [Oscillospiraceae bacterium]